MSPNSNQVSINKYRLSELKGIVSSITKGGRDGVYIAPSKQDMELILSIIYTLEDIEEA